MPGSPKLYLNHDVHKSAADILRREGFDVVATGEVGLGTATDEEQLEFATKERRALVSFNVRDYPSIHVEWSAKGKEHWGVILSRQLPLRETLQRLRALLGGFAAEDLKSQLRWL